MEFDASEILKIERVISQTSHDQLKSLNELELAMVGGGNATVDFG